MTTPAPPQTVVELRKAQAHEYGQYVARVPININGGRAFNPGDPVPVSHVKSGVVDKSQVEAAAVTSEKG